MNKEKLLQKIRETPPTKLYGELLMSGLIEYSTKVFWVATNEALPEDGEVVLGYNPAHPFETLRLKQIRFTGKPVDTDHFKKTYTHWTRINVPNIP